MLGSLWLFVDVSFFQKITHFIEIFPVSLFYLQLYSYFTSFWSIYSCFHFSLLRLSFGLPFVFIFSLLQRTSFQSFSSSCFPLPYLLLLLNLHVKNLSFISFFPVLEYIHLNLLSCYSSLLGKQNNSILGSMCKQITLFGHFRILYGRMKNKTGSKTQGKSASGTRVSIVLRFLAGSQPEEMEIFLDLLFEPVKHFRNGRYQPPATLWMRILCSHICCLRLFPALWASFSGAWLLLPVSVVVFLLTCWHLHLIELGGAHRWSWDYHQPCASKPLVRKRVFCFCGTFWPFEKWCQVRACAKYLVAQLCPTLCHPTDCSPPGSSLPGNSPGTDTGVGCLSLLWRIFPTQGWNPSLPCCERILYHLSHQGSPWKVVLLHIRWIP